MTENIKSLTSILNTEALKYAIYTVENRAIPNMIDGLKPVQRFFLYSALRNAKDFTKVVAIAGRVSEYGYFHGEISAQDAGKLMASDWSNNVQIIEGKGNFGSRMVQESAASRYVFARPHNNFKKYFLDTNIVQKHKDIEHIPPAFYVPIIPMVLLNGISGIATGFACNILPHCPDWVTKATSEYLKKKKITSEPVIKFPAFNGKVIKQEGQKYVQQGIAEISGLTVTVTEIPSHFDHTKYSKLLDMLQDKGTISSWKDDTSDTFRYVVRFKRGTKMSMEKVYKDLKLTSSFTQNINVIYNGKLRHYDDVRDLIGDFCEFRLKFLTDRITINKDTAKQIENVSIAKCQFINEVISGKIVLHGKTKKQLVTELNKLPWANKFTTELLSMTVDKMTNDELVKLEKEKTQAINELKYWNNTTELEEFVKDLKQL